MQRFKFGAAALLCALALPAWAAQPLRIGAAVYGLKGEFMQMWVDALKRHPAVKDGSVQITVFDGRYDALTQNNQFDTMITQKYDAILFVPIDIAAGAEAVAKAARAKIPVIGSNTRVNGDQLTAYIGNNDTVAGELQAEAVAKALKGKGNVVIMEGPIGQSAQLERSAGNQKALARYPGIKVLERKPANWSRAEALTLMENWLTARPGQINGLIGQNDDIALGGLEAVRGKGLDPRKMPAAGIDGIRDGIVAVKNGTLMVSFFQDAKAQAQGALDLALRAVKGPAYQPRSAIWREYAKPMPWAGGAAKRYDVPWTTITPANADALLAKLKPGA